MVSIAARGVTMACTPTMVIAAAEIPAIRVAVIDIAVPVVGVMSKNWGSKDEDR
jgi:hypothetical protein